MIQPKKENLWYTEGYYYSTAWEAIAYYLSEYIPRLSMFTRYDVIIRYNILANENDREETCKYVKEYHPESTCTETGLICRFNFVSKFYTRIKKYKTYYKKLQIQVRANRLGKLHKRITNVEKEMGCLPSLSPNIIRSKLQKFKKIFRFYYATVTVYWMKKCVIYDYQIKYMPYDFKAHDYKTDAQIKFSRMRIKNNSTNVKDWRLLKKKILSVEKKNNMTLQCKNEFHQVFENPYWSTPLSLESIRMYNIGPTF